MHLAKNPMKLYYFPAPGRAECSRIMLGASGTAFEDIRFKREEWVETYKAMSPTGQSPFLELDDGKVLAQSSAIDHYVASLTGFLPTDAWTLAKTDELLACLEDVRLPHLLHCVDPGGHLLPGI